MAMGKLPIYWQELKIAGFPKPAYSFVFPQLPGLRLGNRGERDCQKKAAKNSASWSMKACLGRGWKLMEKDNYLANERAKG